MDYNIRNLMEFWDLSFEETLLKIVETIRLDREYFLSFDNPIKAVKKFVILNKKYKSDLISLDNERYVEPKIIISDYQTPVKHMKFSSSFFRQLFPYPKFVQIFLRKDNVIQIFFSEIKKPEFLKITNPSEISNTFGQISLNGFLRLYDLKMKDIEGIYRADIAFKRDETDPNIFYMYIDKREIQGKKS